MAEQRVSIESLEEYCAAILVRAGLSEGNAKTVAESLVFADLRGIDSHGVVRLSSYLKRIEAGVANPDSKMQIESEYPATVLLDAQNGLGQIAGTKAMGLAIEKAGSNGIGMAGVKNSSHFGAASFFAVKALCHDMIGLVLTNASPAMAPYGSKVAFLGTNPLSVAIPAAKQKPIVLDMATSVAARGKIRLASKNGGKIPKDWALDSNGHPTDDPMTALKGTLAPIGGPKGSGLSLVIDLLCGVLTNSSLTGEVINLDDTSGPCRTGHMFMAIDISKFGDPTEFKDNIDKVILRIKSLSPINGHSILLPGEIEFDLEKRHRAEGIPVEADMVASLGELAERYGVSKSWEECVSRAI